MAECSCAGTEGGIRKMEDEVSEGEEEAIDAVQYVLGNSG